MLTSLPMLSPHESLNLNPKRGLLAAEMGNGGSAPGLMSIYDVSHDCLHPVLDATYLASRFGHESGFSPDGNTLYDSDPIDGDLTLLDVSQIQARSPHPTVNEISRLTWGSVSVPQNTDPMQIHGKSYLLEFDEFAFRFNPPTVADTPGAARIVDISDPAHPRVVSNLRLAVSMPTAHQAADGDPSPLPTPAFNYSGHYCAIPGQVDPGCRQRLLQPATRQERVARPDRHSVAGVRHREWATRRFRWERRALPCGAGYPVMRRWPRAGSTVTA